MTSSNAGRPAHFDDLAPGQDWGVHVWTATDSFCAQWQEITGDDLPSYHPSQETIAAYGGALLPPSLAWVFLAECIKVLMPLRPPGGIQVRQQLTFFGPIFQGDTLSTGLHITGKYIKRGRKYVESFSETRNERGEKVLEGTRVNLWQA